jgi:hypothetical protein
MTATLPDSVFQSAARYRLPDLLTVYEGLARLSLDTWDKLCQDALRVGDAEPLHATRDPYEAYLRGELDRLDLLIRTIDSRPESSGEYRMRFVALRDQLATHFNKLFPRWQTLEDLEGILLEPLTPSRETRLELVKRYPPPQAWYDETVDPFQPEE